MCGIIGLLSFSGEASRQTLHRGMRALSHRGPDGEGQYLSTRVALGHTRLAILDLHTGKQPLSSEDGMIHAVDMFPTLVALAGASTTKCKQIGRAHV